MPRIAAAAPAAAQVPIAGNIPSTADKDDDDLAVAVSGEDAAVSAAVSAQKLADLAAALTFPPFAHGQCTLSDPHHGSLLKHRKAEM